MVPPALGRRGRRCTAPSPVVNVLWITL